MDHAFGLGPPRVRVGLGGRVWLGPGRQALWANVTWALPGPTQGHMINGPTESRSGQPCSACTTGVSGPGLGPGDWNLLSLPPPSRSSNVRWSGLELALLFGDIWTAHQPFSLQEEECSLRLMCLGFVCLGLERPSNCPFPCGVWWVTFPSSSPRKKNKQLRAHGSSCGTLSKTERRREKKKKFQP